MSATNKTTYYDLPIFIGTDTPSWLGDWNNTMNSLDTAINGVKTVANSATNVANTAEGKSDANTESISALNTEVQTLKEAVQNYDSILDFKQVNLALNPNNTTPPDSTAFMVQNTNKTLNRLWFSITIKNPWSNPTSYVYTEQSGTNIWYDLFTIEDNCFNLNQGSLPNYNIVLTLGPFISFRSAGSFSSAYFLRAWYDGATTHFGFCTTRTVGDVQGSYMCGIMPVFLSGSVYNPDDPDISLD